MRVLLVEDDRVDYEIIHHKLHEISGEDWQLDWAETYEKGFLWLAEGRHDVALIDYRLGVRDGLELIREAVQGGSTIPLILLTGRSDRAIDLAAMEAGASDFLPKSELDARIIERSIRYAVRHKRAENALRASDAEARKLALVAARTENSVIITDAQGRVEWVNEGFTRITGYAPDEILGRKPGSVLQGPDSDPAVIRTMREKLRGGEGFFVEVVNYRKDGRPLWISMEVQPVHSGSGRLENFIAIQTDISRRKEGEAALRDSHRQVESILGRITDGFFALDREWRFTFFNRKAEQMLGKSWDEVRGLDFRGAFPEALGSTFLDHYRRAMDDSIPVSFEDFFPPSGRWFSVHVYPSADGLSAYFTDVTERRISEEALRRSEAQYRLLAENSTDLITRHDPDGCVLYASPASEPLLGIGPEAMRGRPIEEFIHPEDRQAYRRASEEQLRSTVTGRIKYRMVRVDGQSLWVETTGHAVVDPSSGAPTEFQCTTRDVSEGVRAEGEIRRLNHRLEQRLRRMEALRQVDAAISSGQGLRETLAIVVEQARLQLELDASDLLLWDASSERLEYEVGRGRVRRDSETPDGPDSIALRVARTGRPVNLAGPSLAAARDPWARRLREEGFVSFHAVPILAKGRVRGVLEAFRKEPGEPDIEWLAFLGTLAAQAAIAIDNASLFDGLRATNARLSMAYDSTIEGWARVLDLRDRETEGHSRRVTGMTVRLARAMGLGEAELVHVRRGALLHDIGKMGIPDAILLKPGMLNPEEWEVMKKHPTHAHEMLWPIEFLRPALDIPYCHHEKWDGTGYPRGLARTQVPLPARIFAAVDIWDALIHDRPYRKAWPVEKVKEHIRALAGTQLDPEVVASFLEMIDDDTPVESGAIPLEASQDHRDLEGAAMSPMDKVGTFIPEAVAPRSALAPREQGLPGPTVPRRIRRRILHFLLGPPGEEGANAPTPGPARPEVVPTASPAAR